VQLSPHFSLDEFIHSQVASRYGIDNTPPAELMPTLQRTAQGLERIRLLTGVLVISSGYRCSQLNKRTGGVPGSQHVRGEAADVTVPGWSPEELARVILDYQAAVGFDQLILEYPGPGGWVHVSFTNEPRGEVLTKTAKGYQKGLSA